MSIEFCGANGGDPGSLVKDVKAAIYAIDPDLPVYRIRTMDQAVRDITSPQRHAQRTSRARSSSQVRPR